MMKHLLEVLKKNNYKYMYQIRTVHPQLLQMKVSKLSKLKRSQNQMFKSSKSLEKAVTVEEVERLYLNLQIK
jgi:hypothetical protein